MWVQKGFACRSLFHNSADHPQRRANVFNWAGSYDRMLFSKPAAALYRAQLPGGCARHGRVCMMGQGSASAAAGRDANAGGASQPVSAGA